MFRNKRRSYEGSHKSEVPIQMIDHNFMQVTSSQTLKIGGPGTQYIAKKPKSENGSESSLDPDYNELEEQTSPWKFMSPDQRKIVGFKKDTVVQI